MIKGYKPTPEFVLVLFIAFVLTCLPYCGGDSTSTSTSSVNITETPVSQTVIEVQCYRHGKVILTLAASNILDMSYVHGLSCKVK